MNEQELYEQVGIAVESRLAPSVGQLFTAASVEIRFVGQVIYRGAFGEIAPGQATRPETLFDLDALTELFTATAFLRMVDAGRLWIDTPVDVLLSNADPKLTFYHLLTHSSGLPATLDLCSLRDYEARIEAAESAKRASSVGSHQTLSPLNFILIGLALEALTSLPLDQAVALNILQPLDLRAEYAPLSRHASVAQLSRAGVVLPTRPGLDPHAYDENARCLEGVAGHAGLFGTASDVSTLAQLYLDGGEFGELQLLKEEIAFEATQAQSDGAGLGWRVGGEVCRHTGKTGTSVSIDLSRRLVVSLLTNGVSAHADDATETPIDVLNGALLRDLQRLIDGAD